MREGATLEQALEGCLEDLDGFYTFAVGTADGFAVLRDPIACKPAVMAETDDWVAMASEYRAIAVLPGAEDGGGVGAGARAASTAGSGRPSDGRGGSGLDPREVDLAVTPLRELNAALHAVGDDGPRRWRVHNPRGAHALAAGIDAPIEVEIEGHVGYYCAGMNKHATVRVHGNAGVGRGREHHVRHGGGGRQRQPVGRRHRARRPAGGPRRRLGALRHLDEGRGHRGARLGRAHERASWRRRAASWCAATRARRSATRSTRRASTCAATWPGSAPTASRRRCARSTSRSWARCSSAAGVEGREPSEFRRYGSARRLYNFHVDNAGEY